MPINCGTRVLCVDEKSQVQALDRTAPILPIMPACRRNRPMTTSVTAPPPCSPRWRWPPADVEQACLPRHRHQEFLRFLKQVAKAYPRRRLHLVCDNYATNTPRSRPGWPATRGSPCTSPDLGVVAEHGRDLLRDQHLPGHRRGVRLRTELDHAITTFSTAGTNAATHSPGPRTPTRSSRKPTVNQLPARDTSRTLGHPSDVVPGSRASPNLLATEENQSAARAVDRSLGECHILLTWTRPRSTSTTATGACDHLSWPR